MLIPTRKTGWLGIKKMCCYDLCLYCCPTCGLFAMSATDVTKATRSFWYRSKASSTPRVVIASTHKPKHELVLPVLGFIPLLPALLTDLFCVLEYLSGSLLATTPGQTLFEHFSSLCVLFVPGRFVSFYLCGFDQLTPTPVFPFPFFILLPAYTLLVCIYLFIYLPSISSC